MTEWATENFSCGTESKVRHAVPQQKSDDKIPYKKKLERQFDARYFLSCDSGTEDDADPLASDPGIACVNFFLDAR